MKTESCAAAMLELLRLADAPMSLTGLYERLRQRHERDTIIAAMNELAESGDVFACTVAERNCLALSPPEGPKARVEGRKPLTGALQRLYAMVDGPLTSPQLAAKAGIPRVRATTMLCRLAEQGWLDRVGSIPHPKAGIRCAYIIYQPRNP